MIQARVTKADQSRGKIGVAEKLILAGLDKRAALSVAMGDTAGIEMYAEPVTGDLIYRWAGEAAIDFYK